jgi:glycine oxidase
MSRSTDRLNLNRIMPAQGGNLPNRSSGFDLAVVGAGVIGLSVAWRAAQRGLRVVVLERDMPGAGSSHVAAGMLAPVSEAVLTEQPLLRLGLASAGLYPEFIAALEEASGVAVGYHRCGTLLAARDADEAEALGRELAMRTRLGLAVQRLRASEARHLEPALAPALRLALEIPDDHAVDPRRVVSALAIALARAGGELRNRVEVACLCLSSGRVDGVQLASGERIDADQVVVASGAWGLEGLPEEARIPLRPVKGQIMRLRDPAGPGLLHHVLRMRGAYIVPRGDGRYVLGATMEERGFDTTVTAGAIYELLRDATELLPGLGELVLEEVSAGLRPATADSAPVIGAGALPGLSWATGHYRNGVLLAPVTADAVVAGIAGEAVEDVVTPFAPTRFAAVAVSA